MIPIPGVTFGTRAVTTAPTNLIVTGTLYTDTNVVTEGSSGNITGTTATNIVTVTPAAFGNVYPAHFFGTMELPANAAGSTILRLIGLTADATKALVIHRGSYCTLF